MTVARDELVDLAVTRYYHCIARCGRAASLGGQGARNRKPWIEDRWEVLAGCFAVSVCGFAILDHRCNLLLRLDPENTGAWSAAEVLRRWFRAHPPKTLRGDEIEVTPAWIDHQARDGKRVEELRKRLGSLGWFMKAWKEPLSRRANREDQVKGTFWEGRYKSIAIVDDEALLAACAYIDLIPVVAGIAATPESSPHTSLRQRIRNAKTRGKRGPSQAAEANRGSASRDPGSLEQDFWLCPLDDRRRRGPRAGMFEGLSLASYRLLVDYSGRVCRHGKARVSPPLADLLQRLGTSPDVWNRRMHKLFQNDRQLGRYFAADPERLRQIASQRGLHHLDNVAALR